MTTETKKRLLEFVAGVLIGITLLLIITDPARATPLAILVLSIAIEPLWWRR